MAEYVLVIHGTLFSALEDSPPEASVPEDSFPEKKKKKWFQLDPTDPQNFCHRLNQELATGKLKDSVWRQGDKTEVKSHWNWSGGNTHAAREDGAKELCDRLLEIRGSDPEAEIHLVAHSHGGNVVLRAIELYFEQLEREAERIVDYVTRYVTRANVRDDAVVIDEALKEVCSTALANSEQFRRLASLLILPILHKLGDFKNKNPWRMLLAVSSRLNPSLRLQMQIFLETQIRPGLSTSRRVFRAAWSRSHQSHRLGRLVFMGTPFYYKRWLPGSRLSRDVAFFINVLLGGRLVLC